MSSSPQQIAANRQNAALSTGPRSVTGKTASSQNRTSHGLTACRTVLKSELQSDFDQLLAGTKRDYQPATLVEEQLCLEITECFWRLQRASRLETDLLDQSEDFLAISDDLDKIRRYRTSIERAWHKAIDQLIKLQTARQKQQPPPAPKRSMAEDLIKQYLYGPVPVNSEELSEEAEEEFEENGFVSQSAGIHLAVAA